MSLDPLCRIEKLHLRLKHSNRVSLKKHLQKDIFYGYHPVVLCQYRKVASSNTSYLEAHAGFFRLLMKGIFDTYVLCLLDKKLIF